MRMLLTMLLLIFISTASFAVNYNRADYSAVCKTRDKSKMLAYLTTVTTNPGFVVNQIVRWSDKKGFTSEQVIALVDKIATERKCTDEDYILFTKLQHLCNTVKDYKKALELCLTGKGKRAKGYLGYCYYGLKEYDKCIEAFKASKDYYQAARLGARGIGFPNVLYSLYKDALLKKKLNVAQANDIFKKLAGLDLYEADISNKQLLSTYRRIDVKYSSIVKVNGENILQYDALKAHLSVLMPLVEKRIKDAE